MQSREVDNSSPCSKDHILHTIYNTYNFHKSTFLSQSNKTNNKSAFTKYYSFVVFMEMKFI